MRPQSTHGRLGLHIYGFHSDCGAYYDCRSCHEHASNVSDADCGVSDADCGVESGKSDCGSGGRLECGHTCSLYGGIGRQHRERGAMGERW